MSPLYYRVECSVGSGRRLVLEIASEVSSPVARVFAQRIDRIKNLLVAGKLCPDQAHAMLIDCRWLGRTAAASLAGGLRALCA